MNNQHTHQTFRQRLLGLLHNRSRFLLFNCIVACSLLALLVGGCTVGRDASTGATTYTSGTPSNQDTTSGNSVSQSFTVQGTPTLAINNDAGSITSARGSNGGVAVTATKYSSDGNTSDMTVSLRQAGDTIYITGRLPQQSSRGDKHIDFAITTPTTTNVQVNTKAGLVQMQGISGQMAVDADAADIHMQQGTLQGNSTLQTTAGAITFQGSLDPHSTDNFNSTAGAISLTLPSDASFELKATASVGTINNEFGSDVVGSPSYAQVTVTTLVGRIIIHKA